MSSTPESATSAHVERRRYDHKAQRLMEASTDQLAQVGARAVPASLRGPYTLFEKLCAESTPPDGVVVDLCCGTGLYSFAAMGSQPKVVVGCDVSPGALAVAATRGALLRSPLSLVCCDCLELPLRSGSADVVSMAGSLSYFDLPPLLTEVCRVLKPQGTLVCVDSFGHNPFYHLNRILNILRRKRTWFTYRRIPTEHTVSVLRQRFRDVEVTYHGVFAFLVPALIGFREEQCAAILEWLDVRSPLPRRWAFKAVIRCKTPRERLAESTDSELYTKGDTASTQ